MFISAVDIDILTTPRSIVNFMGPIGILSVNIVAKDTTSSFGDCCLEPTTICFRP